jgi:hypothetical protein
MVSGLTHKRHYHGFEVGPYCLIRSGTTSCNNIPETISFRYALRSASIGSTGPRAGPATRQQIDPSTAIPPRLLNILTAASDTTIPATRPKSPMTLGATYSELEGSPRALCEIRTHHELPGPSIRVDAGIGSGAEDTRTKIDNDSPV